MECSGFLGECWVAPVPEQLYFITLGEGLNRGDQGRGAVVAQEVERGK